MDFKLGLNLQELQAEMSLSNPDMEIHTPDECKSTSNELDAFEEVLLDSSVAKRAKRVPEIWSGPKVPMLLSFLEEIGPKVKNSLRYSSKNKAWVEIQRRFELEGYTMTVKQITNKYCGLVRQYERIKKRNKETGRNLKCPYAREIERVRAVWPKCLRDSHSEDDLFDSYDRKDDCECGKESNVFCCWSKRRVKFLLSNIEELLPKIGNTPELKRKLDMWRAIVRRFGGKGCQISIQQVTNKFSSLIRQYRRAQTRNKYNTKKPLTCAFKEEIDRIVAIQKTARCDLMNDTDIYEDTICTTDSNHDGNDTANRSDKFSSSFAAEANSSQEFQDASLDEEAEKLKGIRGNYYKERMEYYQRMKLHMQRKEEHMRKKEALLEAILSSLESKNEDN